MSTPEEFATWPGHDAFAPDGQRIGMVDRVYVDGNTGTPTFAVVLTGLLNDVPRFVPVDGAWLHDDHVHLVHGAEVIAAAPELDPGDALDPEAEEELREHYVIVEAGAEEAEMVERELPVREPMGHGTVEQDTVPAPVVEPS